MSDKYNAERRVKIRQEYCNDKGYAYFNSAARSEYSNYLESRLIKAEQQANENESESKGCHIDNVSVSVCYFEQCLDQYNGKCLHSGMYEDCRSKQTER